jgi:hypothetical protein
MKIKTILIFVVLVAAMVYSALALFPVNTKATGACCGGAGGGSCGVGEICCDPSIVPGCDHDHPNRGYCIKSSLCNEPGGGD